MKMSFVIAVPLADGKVNDCPEEVRQSGGSAGSIGIMTNAGM